MKRYTNIPLKERKRVEIIFNIQHDEMLDMLNTKISRLKNRISGGT